MLRIAVGALVGAPALLAAQQTGRVHRIGFFYFGSRQTALDTGRYEAFLEGMRKLGYVQGKDFVLEERFADGKAERATTIAQELVRLKPDVIVATGFPAYRALRNVTATLPIVVTVTADPVGAGIAASVARPGGNFTGLSDTASILGPKHLELLVAAVPSLSRVATLTNPDNASHPLQFVRTTAEAQRIGRQTVLVEARTLKELESAFTVIPRDRIDGLIVFADTFFVEQVRTVAELALQRRLPAIWGRRM